MPVLSRASAGVIVAALVACGKSSLPGPSPNPAVLNGLYTLRIESDCAALPTEVRERTYIASITGTTVTLGGATFWKHPTRGLLNTFSIVSTGDTISLSLGQQAAPDVRGIVEETTEERFLGIVGTGSGSLRRPIGGQPSIEGSFSAGFGWGQNLMFDNQHVGCAAANHRATFRFTPGPTAFPAPRVANTMIRLHLNGPASVAPGHRVRFQAIGEMADGSTRDATDVANWQRSTSAIDLGLSGEVSGRHVGESMLTAWLSVPNLLSSLSDSVEVIVVPEGTVRLAGEVSTSNPTQPVAGATAEIVNGPSTGLATVTDWEGRYKLYGVAGAGSLRVSKDGYESQIREVSGSAHQAVNVTLPLVAAVPNVSGTYSLTIAADAGCEYPMPEPFTIRRYTAAITQTGRSLTVTLSGVPFFIREGRGNGFPGQADPGQLTFQLDDNDHFGVGANPDVVEQLNGARVLFLFGQITTDITPTRLTGALDGSLVFADRALPSNGFFWGGFCVSKRHQVVFSR